MSNFIEFVNRQKFWPVEVPVSVKRPLDIYKYLNRGKTGGHFTCSIDAENAWDVGELAVGFRGLVNIANLPFQITRVSPYIIKQDGKEVLEFSFRAGKESILWQISSESGSFTQKFYRLVLNYLSDCTERAFVDVSGVDDPIFFVVAVPKNMVSHLPVGVKDLRASEYC
ncbi:hypothetical protein [Aurantivibrio plasticivorans]